MKVTMLRMLSYTVFLNDKDEIVGYQLAHKALKSLNISPDTFCGAWPDGTMRVLHIDDVYSSIAYNKSSQDNEYVTIEQYKVYNFSDLVNKVNKARGAGTGGTVNNRICKSYKPRILNLPAENRHCGNCDEINTCLACDSY